jgi:tRNA-2-methylthio-N6-dimethylallyladenosine synthase
MKVYLETMGCQMNRLDSELIEAGLRAAGHELVDDARAADVLLYNTCSVRRHAEEKVHSRLGWACQRKASGRRLVVGVLGCMAQRLGGRLSRRHAGVDIVCGPGQLARLPELIAAAADGGAAPAVVLDPPRTQTGDPAAAEALDAGRDAARTPLPGQAYVRVMRGCDQFCTYCIVPFVRGPERSRPPEAIVEEVRRLAGAGVTQVTLLGQTVSRYRHGPVGLADLLARLDGVPGLRRLRFVTSFPGGFDRAILQAMADLPTVCEYLHIPAQSGSDRMLRAMGRRYGRAEYDELIDAARETVPGIAVAGDFIVGFPGESEADHEASAGLIRRAGYKNSFIFKYSPRPGTAGARALADDVPDAVKRRRNNELLAVQEEVSLAGNRQWVGRTAEVLVEGPSPRTRRQPEPAPAGQTQLIGRTRTDHIVVFNGPQDLAGRYADVRIASATALTLMGERA